MKVYIIIPTYNERENIRPLVEQIMALNLKNTHVLIVDDNSPDGTGKIADKLSRRYKQVEVVHRPQKLGLGTAYVAGFRRVAQKGSDVIVTMDADFFHNPSYIPTLLTKIGQYDLVIGSRYTPGGKITGFNVWRVIISGIAQFLCGFLLGLPARDATSGFRAYKKEVIEKIHPHTIQSQGYSFLIEALYRAVKLGFSVTEVPITAQARTWGKSKISQREILKALVTVARLAS